MKDQLIALAVLIASVGSALAQAPGQRPAPNAAPSPEAPPAVYEAVVRYQIKTWSLGANSYCIRINGQDADKQFLHRFSPLPVKGASECLEKQNKNTMSVVDKHTGKKSVLFGLGAIVWRTATKADVEGSYLCGSQCMEGGVYHVDWDGNNWRVTKYDVYISE